MSRSLYRMSNLDMQLGILMLPSSAIFGNIGNIVVYIIVYSISENKHRTNIILCVKLYL